MLPINLIILIKLIAFGDSYICIYKVGISSSKPFTREYKHFYMKLELTNKNEQE